MARYLVGDVFERLAELPDDSVDLVMSSPPFLALRSYLPADHPDKGKEIGSEPTPADFIDTLLDVVEACGRVLAPHGSLCFELGDTYSGSGQGPDERTYGPGALNGGRRNPAAGWPLDKSLCLIPESFRWALAYGHNPFNGRQTDPWRVRNVVRWHRPNPPVGALGDKFRPSTSDLVVATKSRTRYFDLDAVRDPYSANSHPRTANGTGPQERTAKTSPDGNRATLTDLNNSGAGAPPLDTWVISTEPYPGAHYATFPAALCVKPVLAMCPQRVCEVCGEPSRRITEATNAVGLGHRANRQPGNERALMTTDVPDYAERVTLGWTDCGHASWRRGVVLDPFCGSGTTLAVATGHGRDAIGIDLDERNAELARGRVGMFLTVEYPELFV